MRASAIGVVLGVLAGCGTSPDGGSTYDEAGECAPPADGTPLAVTALFLDATCDASLDETVAVIGSQAAWDAAFPCGVPVPAGLDLATRRAAIVGAGACAPVEHRFTVERADEVVIGVYTWPAGACLGDRIVVPLPQDARPVRRALCYQTCTGECPPVP